MKSLLAGLFCSLVLMFTFNCTKVNSTEEYYGAVCSIQGVFWEDTENPPNPWEPSDCEIWWAIGGYTENLMFVPLIIVVEDVFGPAVYNTDYYLSDDCDGIFYAQCMGTAFAIHVYVDWNDNGVIDATVDIPKEVRDFRLTYNYYFAH